jgi:hypothetical protein
MHARDITSRHDIILTKPTPHPLASLRLGRRMKDVSICRQKAKLIRNVKEQQRPPTAKVKEMLIEFIILPLSLYTSHPHTPPPVLVKCKITKANLCE